MTRCKICQATFPDESDMIDDVWTQRYLGAKLHAKLIGSFCQFCRPPSAYIHPTEMVYVVDRIDNRVTADR